MSCAGNNPATPEDFPKRRNSTRKKAAQLKKMSQPKEASLPETAKAPNGRLDIKAIPWKHDHNSNADTIALVLFALHMIVRIVSCTPSDI